MSADMNRDKFKTDLDQTRRRFAKLLEQKEELEREIAQMRLDIASLAQLAGEPSTTDMSEMGLTRACREVLRAFIEPLTVAELESKLQLMGYDLSSYINPAGSIQTTLARMTKGKNPEAMETIKDDKKAYYLKSLKYSVQRIAHNKRQRKEKE